LIEPSKRAAPSCGTTPEAPSAAVIAIVPPSEIKVSFVAANRMK
jgi:hypothetical protein